MLTWLFLTVLWYFQNTDESQSHRIYKEKGQAIINQHIIISYYSEIYILLTTFLKTQIRFS